MIKGLVCMLLFCCQRRQWDCAVSIQRRRSLVRDSHALIASRASGFGSAADPPLPDRTIRGVRRSAAPAQIRSSQIRSLAFESPGWRAERRRAKYSSSPIRSASHAREYLICRKRMRRALSFFMPKFPERSSSAFCLLRRRLCCVGVSAVLL